MNKSSKKKSNQSIDYAVMVEDVENSSDSVPSGSDMFMGFASSRGFVSYRSKKYGSRFIQTFTTIINDEINSSTGTDKIDFVSLMTKVAAEVPDMSGRSWPSLLAANTECETEQKKLIGKAKMQNAWVFININKKAEI